MAMDVKRDPKILRRKKIRQAIILGVVLIGVGALTVAVSRLKPAAPTVDSQPWVGTVQRGSFTREVRGSGTLVPVDIRWIPAVTNGRVEQLVLHPGDAVTPNSVILILTNPDLEQSVKQAELAWQSGLADLANKQADLKLQLATQQSQVTTAQSNLNLAQARFDANKQLFADQLISSLDLQQFQAQLDQAKTALALAKEQLKNTQDGEKNLVAPQEATVNGLKSDYDLKKSQLDDLHVKAGMTGVLQIIPVEVGQQVGAGTNVARVANPKDLKANIRISETTTKDLRLGQLADIDTRSGHVKGHVSRIDPAAEGGTVGVDVALDGPLPAGARPDLSVDGVVEIQKLVDVVFMGRPAFGQGDQTISLFKCTPQGNEAVRVQVKLGKESVNDIEVLGGLQPGDKVILSDMSAYDAFDRVRCNCNVAGQ